MKVKHILLSVCLVVLCSDLKTFAQCPNNPDRSFNIESSGICAPLNVISFDVSWNRIPLTVATVEIEFDWGDGSVDILPANFISSNAFGARWGTFGTHIYDNNDDQCIYEAVATLILDGVRCDDNAIESSIIVWDNDDTNSGQLRINPQQYLVCAGNQVTLSFTDNSRFNCVPPATEPEVANGANRWTQFLYNTGGSDINGVVVDDPGGAVTLNSGDAPYTGPVEYQNDADNQLFASDAESFQITIPATATPGELFEVTLRNWNICNPYDDDLLDGDPLNPGDPVNGDNMFVDITAQIIIVDAPVVEIETNDPTNIFCLGEEINFTSNVIVGGGDLQYTYEFYSDSLGTSLEATSNNANPSFTFNTPGVKKVRLIVSDQDAFGACEAIDSLYVRMAPNDIARIATLDGNTLADAPLENCFIDTPYDIIFADSTTDENINPSWRWEVEFPDGSDFSIPSAGFFSDTQTASLRTGVDFGDFSDAGIYQVRLFKIDSANECFTVDSVSFIIDNPPVASAQVNSICEDQALSFMSNSTVVSFAGATVDTLYWDFDQNGAFIADTATVLASVNTEPSASGNYVAGLVAESSIGCTDTISLNYEVYPLPESVFIADTLQGCTDLSILFSNESQNQNVDSSTVYRWFVDSGGGFIVDSVQQFTDSVFARTFVNNTESDRLFSVTMLAETSNGCTAGADTLQITVFPAPKLGFSDIDYDIFAQNCSPVEVNFQVDANTQALNPDEYVWTIIGENDTISEEVQNASDTDYNFLFENDSSFVRDFRINLSANKNNVCFRDSVLTIRVNPVPSGEFNAEISRLECDFVEISIEAEEAGLPASRYDWTFNESPSNENFIVFDGEFTAEYPQLTSDNTIEVQLQTRNNVNCQSEVVTRTVTIPGRSPRLLEVEAQQDNICPPDILNFSNNSTGFGPGVTYYFLQRRGNNGRDTVSITSGNINNDFGVQYEEPGNYLVTFIAEEENCLLDTTFSIRVNPVTMAGFRSNLDSGCAPLIPIFVENSTNQSVIDTKTWFIIDTETNERLYGPSSVIPSGFELENNTAEAKLYDIRLAVSTIDGCFDDTVQQIKVFPDVTPIFSVDPLVQELPESTVTFTNNSVDGDFNYTWDFGNDRDSAFVRTPPPFEYGTFGEFQITLTIESDQCRASRRRTVRILAVEPNVNFAFTPNSGCAPLTVEFENLSISTDPDSYVWNFGDGVGSSTAVSPVYTYNEPGRYTVSLTASNPAGDTDIEVKEEVIEVFVTPRSVFQVNPDTVYVPFDPVYTTNLSLDASFFQWDFGDGNIYTQPEPVHIYEETGTYDITLISESDRGCIDTLVVDAAVTVLDGGTIRVPNIFTPSFDGPSGGFVGNGAGSGPGSNNNVFIPDLEGVEEFNMLIYNRWGELIFESNSIDQGWDGYDKNGRLSPQGVYVYKLDIRFSSGREEIRVGDVTLLR